jgi:hypothetical protein
VVFEERVEEARLSHWAAMVLIVLTMVWLPILSMLPYGTFFLKGMGQCKG